MKQIRGRLYLRRLSHVFLGGVNATPMPSITRAESIWFRAFSNRRNAKQRRLRANARQKKEQGRGENKNKSTKKNKRETQSFQKKADAKYEKNPRGQQGGSPNFVDGKHRPQKARSGGGGGTGKSSKQWLKRHVKDGFVKKARAEVCI